MNEASKMLALFLDLENLTHQSFAAEAYRTVERAHGRPPDMCMAFGSRMSVEYTRQWANRKGIRLKITEYGKKNAADKALVKAAQALDEHQLQTLVVGSGDRGFTKWLRDIRSRGTRMECVSREHQLFQEADAWYAAVYRMDAKRMSMPTDSDLRLAVTDCIPEIEAGPVGMEFAISMLRNHRIVSKNSPGKIFFRKHPGVFRLSDDEQALSLV